MRCARLPVRMAQQGGLLIFTCRAHAWETVSGWFQCVVPGGLSFSQVELFVALKSGTLMSHKHHRHMSDGERYRKALVYRTLHHILTFKESIFAICRESATLFSYSFICFNIFLNIIQFFFVLCLCVYLCFILFCNIYYIFIIIII